MLACRLKLVAVQEADPAKLAEDRLAADLHELYRLKGFTNLQTIVTRQLERLSKAHRANLAQEGWIA